MADYNSIYTGEEIDALVGNTSGTNTGDQDLSGLVPYTGATQNVDLGEFQIDAGQVTFDQTPTQAAGVGVLRWNDTDGTLDLGLKGGNVTLQVGQEEVIRIVNKTGANLLESDFRAVRIRTVAEGGAQGQRLAVVLAQANSDINSATTIGLVTENITNNQEGFVTTIGNVNGINTTGAKSFTGTEDWQDGDVLYLDPDHAGYLTNIKPITPAHLIVIGYVEYAHAVNGKIYVKVDNGYQLEELHDVLITDISDNELLQWNSAGYWENRTLSEAGIQPAGSYATSAQGSLADTAVQPADLATVATSGSFLDLDDLPSTLAGYGITDAATSAQGSLADSALQDIVEDTTPQLGGALDTQGNSITGNYSTDGYRGIITETTTTRSTSLTDAGDFILFDNATSSEYRILDNASVTLPIGTEIDLLQKGVGVLTIIAVSGVRLNGVTAGSTTVTARWGGATIKKILTDEWIIVGKINDVA